MVQIQLTRPYCLHPVQDEGASERTADDDASDLEALADEELQTPDAGHATSHENRF